MLYLETARKREKQLLRDWVLGMSKAVQSGMSKDGAEECNKFLASLDRQIHGAPPRRKIKLDKQAAMGVFRSQGLVK